VKTFGIVGGTGLDQLQGLQAQQSHCPDTPFGKPSRPIQEGHWHGCTVYYLQRHGAPLAIPPHKINYRANMWAMKRLGVTDLIAINAVGGISAEAATGTLVIPDQLIDYTWGREHTIDDGSSGELQHIDFTEPYDAELRTALLDVAAAQQIKHVASATHAVTQGPRLETAAEIRRLEKDGCDIVGMTGMPEAALARELKMAYAAICMVVNPAAGLGDEPISLDMMRDTLNREAVVVAQLLDGLVRSAASGSR
jgi:5'-methylthioinosine phosphorylase